MRRLLTKRSLILFGCCAVLWGSFALALERNGRRALPAGERFDAIIVPGCRVEPTGRASLTLERRTRHAVALWHDKRAPRIVLTGGLGRHAPTEARAAASIARRLGVPDEALILEERSTSTEENAHFAARATSARRVLIVTDTFHVYRSERVFRRHFSEVIAVGSIPRVRARATGALREVLALGFYFLAGRL